MNTLECDVLKAILDAPSASQRELAQMAGCSVGSVNKCIRALKALGYLDAGTGAPTLRAQREAEKTSPSNAIILAAGFGMRMLPINHVQPKGLLEIHGEALIERTIVQLIEAGVSDITVVVGFMKEWYEYLREKYGVRFVFNPEYPVRNNLHSLLRAEQYIGNTYIIPCDVWCRDNPYSRHELRSWYMVGSWQDDESTVRLGRRLELLRAPAGRGRAMIGICYVQGGDSAKLRERLVRFGTQPKYNKAYWEEAITVERGLSLPAKVVPEGSVVEINTFEQLRDLDGNSNHLRSPAINAICRALNAAPDEVVNIRSLKKGMTNRSFLFELRGEKYIMRVPGEGTDRLIDRRQEAAVYRVIGDHSICDDIVLIDPETGFKITRFIKNARTCDAESPGDVSLCMARLRRFHELRLSVEHYFDIFAQIDFYESLREGEASAYRDYESTKESVLSLRPFIESFHCEACLTHIDAVPDNFLFCPDGIGGERIVLIDWEYAAMQDPHVDIAMFCIYSMYDRGGIDRAISAYFPEGADERTRYKIYAYIAMCGLLWSNWCEYKMHCGVDFGEYSVCQYVYAREYSASVHEYLERERKNAIQS